MSPEMSSRIATWRARSLAGTLTKAEMVEAIRFLRGDRVAAAAQSEGAKRKRAIAVIPDADDLLAEMGS